MVVPTSLTPWSRGCLEFSLNRKLGRFLLFSNIKSASEAATKCVFRVSQCNRVVGKINIALLISALPAELSRLAAPRKPVK